MRNKKFLSLVLTFIIIASLFYNFNYKVVNAASTANPNPAPTAIGGLKLEKKAVPVPGDPRSFDITLKVTGAAASSKTDVVLVLDNSGSMSNTWPYLLTATSNLINKLGSVRNIRMSTVYFSNDAHILTNSFNNTPSQIISKINSLQYPYTGSGGTNTADGFEKAANQLSISRNEIPQADRYVVFFTDGMPSLPYQMADSYNRQLAQQKYQAVVATGAKVMTVAYTSNIGDASQINAARPFMNSIQNAGIYEATSQQALNNAFDSIAQSIHPLKTIGKNVNVQDIVPPEYSIVQGSSKVTDLYTGQVVNKQPTINNNTLNWNIGDLSSDGVTITFRVHVKDDYYHKDNNPTNTKATINYTDVTSNNTPRVGTFPIPSVDISPQKAKVTITKKVIADPGVVIPSTTANDNFSFTFEGGKANESYKVDLKKNQPNTLEFLLKDSNTTNLKQGEKYLTIGDFNLTENKLSNYELESVLINGQKVDKNHPTFKIDKDHKDVNIVVTNKYKPGPTKVKVTVKKEVITDNGVTAPSNDIFPISITSNTNNEKYILNLKGGESKSIELYLKDNNTLNNLHDLSYSLGGNFTVSEVVPMNYQLISIDHQTISIDKTNTDITVTVKNKYSNKNYFTDSETINNKLKLTN